MNKKSSPLVTTVTPVLNGEQYIGTHLESLKNQTYPHIEMIVVDNFSTDNTRKIAKKYGATVYTHGPERAFQDNYGVERARGKYVFITGSDMSLEPEYIEQCVKACEEERYDAIYSSVRSHITNYWSHVKWLEREAYIGDDLIESARFFKRSVFLAMGGYNTSMILHADDFDMQKRLNDAGYRTGRIASVEIHLDEVDSLKTVMLKSFYYGMHSSEYLKKHKIYAATQLSPVRTAYFRRIDLFLRHPILTLGFIVFKIVQYSSASIGLLSGILGLREIGNKLYKIIYRKNLHEKKDEQTHA